YPSDNKYYGDTEAPQPPGPVTVNGVTGSALRLSWGASGGDTGASSSGLAGYLVVRASAEPTTVPLANATYRTNYNSSLGTGTVVYYGPTTVTSFTDAGLLPGTTYFYRVYAFDNALNYSVASAASGTTTCIPPTPGVITVQPGLPVCTGTPVTLTQTASGGSTPYTYRWIHNSSIVEGATASTLTIPDPKQGDNYFCEVRSSCGGDWAASPVLQLQVSQPPAVAPLLASLLGNEGGTVRLQVEASGEGLSYQWRKEGAVVAGATGSALALNPLRVADAGNYDVVVASGACATNSTVLVLAVNQLPLAPTVKLSRARGISLKISLAELLAGCSDPDQDPISFLGVDQGQQGAQVSYDSTFIYYLPASDQDDVLSYSVGDNRGGSRSGRIEIGVISEVVEARTISVVEGVVRVRFAGIPGHGYRVERSSTTSGGTWEQVESGRVPAGGVFEFEDGAAPKTGAYYRLVVEPQ
ncbi:MAG TPA: hypothetical protein VNT26_09060, partial [Candidatus Sulfotelmatobacter sp.]|nr:hypothetical protein [Candidatus Sulfotelmatobacter sp.]